jgi:hypothetical protein
MNETGITLIKDLSIIIAGLIALITFATGVFQYIRQGHQIRATQFIEMRRRFLEDLTFRQILNLLATDSPDLEGIPIQDRRNFIGFLEEVALMVNSRLIRPRVAHYMFGYYVLLVDDSKHLWAGLDKSSEYWQLFHGFANSIRQMRNAPAPAPKELVF